ncbi:hypothetical protein J6590_000076 [Homalodisca vitripennis]|nr:hypothetical protein J6590_000076 [Homalodisca vitripennis]
MPYRRTLCEEVVLCRLATRLHTAELRLSYVSRRDDPPVWATCDTVVTVVCFLVDCPLYSRHRRNVNLPAQLKSILSDEEPVVDWLLSFLKQTFEYEKEYCIKVPFNRKILRVLIKFIKARDSTSALPLWRKGYSS